MKKKSESQVWEWDKLTAKEFPKAVKASNGLCLLPVGCIEKHGDHLPLGTDAIAAYEIAKSAALKEKAVVFPYFYLSAVTEVRHQPGTVALRYDVMLPLLENICDEIRRNGFDKILIVNFHGGNIRLFAAFGGILLERPKDYVVYFSDAWEFDKSLHKSPSTAKVDGHAGELESSLMLLLTPNSVKSPCASENGLPQGKLKHLKKVLLGNSAEWYSNHPNQLCADDTPGSVEKGTKFFKIFVDTLISQIRVAKKDKSLKRAFQEFHCGAANPCGRKAESQSKE